jgi:hypothetical protein
MRRVGGGDRARGNFIPRLSSLVVRHRPSLVVIHHGHGGPAGLSSIVVVFTSWSCRGGPTWWLSSRSVVVIVFASWLSVILLSMGGRLGALAAIVSLGVVKQEGLEGTYQWGDVVERKKER